MSQIKNEEQSVLDVCVRFGHIKLVEYFLKLDWPVEYLKSGLKEALDLKHEILIKMLKKAIAENKIKHRKNYCSCFN